MRVFITLIMLAAALASSSEAVSALTVSSQAKLAQVSTSESVNTVKTEYNGARFLRTKEENDVDDLDSEERGLSFPNLATKMQEWFSKEQKAVALLSKSESTLLRDKVDPAKVLKAANRIKDSKSLPKAEIERLYKNGETYFYRHGNLDPIRD
ncbi:unnamed protein product [Phytophthora lilii]|uniref:RxLR effector protein n=1 Tax=Phytophthora lilii TaxID=2077276 RepID=A0A9W6TJY5_9STRA|nr:unnamed protein product [Phytophthora lilii]